MEDYDPTKEPLHLRLNMCDIARFSVLAPIGDVVAAVWKGFTYGTDCGCCLGTRLILWTTAVAAVAYGAAVLLK